MAKRQFVSFPFSDLYKIKQQVLNWSARFDTCSFLDNQSYQSGDTEYECLVAVGAAAALTAGAGHAFESLKKFSVDQDDWLFGHFSFDLKSETEQSISALPDFIQFPDLFFFVPDIVVLIYRDRLEIGLHGNNHLERMNEIVSLPAREPDDKAVMQRIQKRISKEEYIRNIEQLRLHILRGDCYEINFCQEFYIENAEPEPLDLFQALTEISPNPFSAFYKTDEHFLFCASPERYLKRVGDRIFSQPIKGTAARDLHNKANDERLRSALGASDKDRTENVMIVDLVRNDLSKICTTDTVQVTELFGIYSFPQVHQMISTIEGKPLPGLHWSELIAKTFPMGSMTGAPKKRVLELIEQYEKTKRGLFSGALGYVKPNQDFDFNVVIRSLLYNKRNKYLTYFAGSGITINSEPEKEYDECLLKAAAFEEIIKRKGHKKTQSRGRDGL